MSQQQTNTSSSQNSAFDAFSKVLGTVLGLLGTMPLFYQTYDYFYGYALQYADYSNHWAWTSLWIICLFLLIFTGTWLVLRMIVGAPGLIVSWLIIVFRLLRR